jgi:hypothetical protein
MHYNFDPLDTEFGAYYMNYHSRLPIFSGKGGSGQRVQRRPAWSVVWWAGACRLGVATSLAPTLLPVVVAANSSYYVEYPEDIHLFGLSFSTTLPTGTAWSGEVSYRPNAPVQLNTTDILYSGLTPLNPSVSVLQGAPGHRSERLSPQGISSGADDLDPLLRSGDGCRASDRGGRGGLDSRRRSGKHFQTALRP